MENKKQVSPEMMEQMLQTMDDFIWELQHRSTQDAWCMDRAADVAARIKAYEDAVSGLTPEQRETIEDYIAACEDFEYSHVYIAYTLGREHQRLGIPSPLFMRYL